MNEKEADLQSWRACRRLLTSVCTQTTRNRTFTTRVTKSFTTTGVDRNSYQITILYLGLFLPKLMNFWKIFEQPLTFEIMLHISPGVYDQNDFFICTKFAMAFLDRKCPPPQFFSFQNSSILAKTGLGIICTFDMNFCRPP